MRRVVLDWQRVQMFALVDGYSLPTSGTPDSKKIAACDYVLAMTVDPYSGRGVATLQQAKDSATRIKARLE